MKDLIDKLSSYNIFNYLLPGVVFVAIASSLTKYNFVQKDIVIGVFLYYFIGLVISRIGSVVIEPILKWTGFVRFSEYRDYVDASHKDKLIEVLSEANNMYRTFISLFLSLSLLKIYEALSEQFQCLNSLSSEIAIVGLLALFAFSYRKQTAYITKRVASAKDKD
ncbi:hypothetical protein [Shewanella indica]|uniref:hypothetical protein n=1 Tax=Shewanella indica TaxID=768528 RepID=UPI00399B7BAA